MDQIQHPQPYFKMFAHHFTFCIFHPSVRCSFRSLIADLSAVCPDACSENPACLEIASAILGRLQPSEAEVFICLVYGYSAYLIWYYDTGSFDNRLVLTFLEYPNGHQYNGILDMIWKSAKWQFCHSPKMTYSWVRYCLGAEFQNQFWADFCWRYLLISQQNKFSNYQSVSRKFSLSFLTWLATHMLGHNGNWNNAVMHIASVQCTSDIARLGYCDPRRYTKE